MLPPLEPKNYVYRATAELIDPPPYIPNNFSDILNTVRKEVNSLENLMDKRKNQFERERDWEESEESSSTSSSFSEEEVAIESILRKRLEGGEEEYLVAFEGGGRAWVAKSHVNPTLITDFEERFK